MNIARTVMAVVAGSAALFAVLTSSSMAADAALTGQVTSAEEGAMEGVVVSAKRDGSTITISVVTDAKARVLRDDGSTIEGLYATGVSTASVMGRSYPGAGSSVGPSFTWGYVAARNALAEAAATT